MGDLIKSLFPEDKSKNGLKFTSKQRKYITWLALVAFIGVAALSFGNIGGKDNSDQVVFTEEAKTPPLSQSNSNLAIAEKEMEDKLSSILSQISGVGKTVVDLTLESTSQYNYAFNTKVDKTVITEKAQDGSTRATDETREETQVVMQNMSQGKNEPVVVKEVRPQVIGVMVVAEGADDLLIRERISEAVQTVLNIPAHRVTVLPKGK